MCVVYSLLSYGGISIYRAVSKMISVLPLGANFVHTKLHVLKSFGPSVGSSTGELENDLYHSGLRVNQKLNSNYPPERPQFGLAFQLNISVLILH